MRNSSNVEDLFLEKRKMDDGMMNDVDFAKTSGGRHACRLLIGCNLRASRDVISCFLCFVPTFVLGVAV